MKREINVAHVVDQLGAVKASMDNEKKQVQALQADLIELAAYGPARSFDGEKYKAVVSFADKPHTDYRALLEALVLNGLVTREVLAVYLKTYTEVAPSVPSVRTYARS